MAEQNVSDLIMKFVGDDGNAIIGETLTDLNLRKCAMSSGFVEGQMFEIQSFTFQTGLGGQDENEVAQKEKEHAEKYNQMQQNQIKQVFDATNLAYSAPKMPKSADFKQFRTNKNSTTKYPVDMRPMEFNRPIDISSPVLLDYCIKRRIFKSASLIKRKAAGGPASGDIFLRFDFKTVLIKSLNWDNDEPIKEKCEFVCRAVTINYLPQLPDGTLGAPIQAFWSAVKGLTAEKLS